MKQVTLFAILALLFGSCKAFFGTVYGFNRNINFKSSDEYLSYVEKKRKIPRSSILIPDSTIYGEFLETVINEQMGILYGSFLNDSTRIKRSEELEENVTCMGRVLSDVRNNVVVIGVVNDSLVERYDFNQFTFRNAEDGSVYGMESSTKPVKLFLLYYYSGGNYFDKHYKAIFDFANDHKDQIDVKVIVTDRVAIE